MLLYFDSFSFKSPEKITVPQQVSILFGDEVVNYDSVQIIQMEWAVPFCLYSKLQ